MNSLIQRLVLILVFVFGTQTARCQNKITDSGLSSFDAEWEFKDYRRPNKEADWNHVATFEEEYSIRTKETFYESRESEVGSNRNSRRVAYFDGRNFFTRVGTRVNHLEFNEVVLKEPKGVITHPGLFAYWGVSIPRLVQDFESVKGKVIIDELKLRKHPFKKNMNLLTFDDWYFSGSKVKIDFSTENKLFAESFVRTLKGKVVVTAKNSDWRLVKGLGLSIPFKTERMEYHPRLDGEYRKSVFVLKSIKPSEKPIEIDKSEFQIEH